MATYTNSGGRLVATGADVAAAGIHAAIVADPALGSSTELLSNGWKSYAFNFSGGFTLGDGGTTATIWKELNASIAIRAADTVLIDGATLQLGEIDGNGLSTNGCAIWVASDGTFTGTDAPTASRRSFMLLNGAILRCYATSWIQPEDGIAYHSGACEISFFDSVFYGLEMGVGNYGTGFTPVAGSALNFIRSAHHQIAISLSGFATADISGASIISSADVAIIAKAGTSEFKNIEVASAGSQIQTNNGAVTANFINPDWTVLLPNPVNVARGPAADDVIFRSFSYRPKAIDAAQAAVAGATFFFVDAEATQSSFTTGADGVPVGMLTDADGEAYLRATIYDAIVQATPDANKRTLTPYIRYAFKYGFEISATSLDVSAEITDFAVLTADAAITEANKALVDAYAEISSLDRLYDRARAWKVDNFGALFPAAATQLATAAGATLDLGALNLIVDPQAAQPFAVDQGTGAITIDPGAGLLAKTAQFDRILTTGTVTFLNGASTDAIVTDAAGTLSSLTLTGLQPGSEVRIFNAGTTTEIGGIEASGTSFAFNYTHTADFDVDIAILSIGFLNQRIEGVTLTASPQSLPVRQIIDRQFENL